MFFAKNLPTWERVVRFLGAVATGGLAWYFHDKAMGAALGVTAALTGLSAVVGFCPMCALAGRRLARKVDGPK